MFQSAEVLKRPNLITIWLGATVGAVIIGLGLVITLSGKDGIYWFIGGADLALSFIFYPFGILQLIFLSLIGELASEETIQLTALKILGFVVALRRLFDLTFLGRPLRVAQTPIMVGALVFVLALGLSIFASRDIYASLTALLTYLQLLVMFMLIIDFVRGERELKYIIAVLVLGGVVNATVALYQSHFENLARVHSLIGNANRLGIIQLMLLSQIAPVIVSLPAGGLLSAGLFASGLVAYSILLTVSRGAFVAAVVAALYYFLFLRSGGARAKIALGAVTVAGLVLAPEGFYDRIETIPAVLSGTQLHEGSVTTRLLYLRAGIQMGLDHLLTGVGLGQFDHHVATYATMHTVKAGGAHNMYVSVFAEAGSIGLITFLGLLAASFAAARGRRRLTPSGTRFRIAFADAVELGIVVLLIGGLFATLEYSKVMWLLLALAAVAHNLGIRQKDAALE